MPSSRTLPLVGLSMQPITFSSVVLPEPDGPMIATNSPAFTVRFRFDKAGTSRLPSVYVLLRFSNCSTGLPD